MKTVVRVKRVLSWLAAGLLFTAGTVCYGQLQLEWVKQTGGTGIDGASAVTVDAAGNVYTVGHFSGTVDFDPGPGIYNLTASENKGFVTKMDAAGNLLWAKCTGGDGSAITADGQGNVFVTGSFIGTVDFNPGPGTWIINSHAGGKSDIFILKLDPAGTFQWVQVQSGYEEDRGQSIAIDPLGDVIVIAYQMRADGKAETYIYKLKTNASWRWIYKIAGTSAHVFNRSVATDGVGNVYITGEFSGSVDFNPGSGYYYLSAAYSDVFVLKLDSLGHFVWAKQMVCPGGGGGVAIAADLSGNVYTTGYFYTTADFNPGPGNYILTSKGLGDAFISKLDASGNFAWAINIGGSNGDAWDTGIDIEVATDGNVYTLGEFYGVADFNPGSGVFELSSQDGNTFLNKLTANGAFVWAKQWKPSTSSLYAYIPGIIYTVGSFTETVDFDPGPGAFNLTSNGASDAFILKLIEPSSLPVTLSNFTVRQNGNANLLSWEAAEDQGLLLFVVERCASGFDFSTLGSITASTQPYLKQYSFTDVQPFAGTTFYRVKIMFKDGSPVYSNVIAVNSNRSKHTVKVFPVPVTDVLQVQASGDGMATIRIVDASGRMVKQQITPLNGVTSFSINVHELTAGHYYLVIENKGAKEVKEFLKQ